MGFYRKKPVKIEARQWLGGMAQALELSEWAEEYKNKVVFNGRNLDVYSQEGIMQAWPGSWIVRGIKNEFYVIAPDIFSETYEEA